jgi:hypothetical protein
MGHATSTGEDISGQRWFSGGGAGFGSPRGSGGKGGGRSSVNTSLTFDLLVVWREPAEAGRLAPRPQLAVVEDTEGPG